MTFLQFVGDPRGHNGPYTFHGGFKFFKHGKYKVILLGQFFFVRISAHHDPCIGELLMLWDDRHSNQRLSSVRLYFLPEQTPEGRLSYHGEHEVLAASDKVNLRVDDLIGWITDQVDWNHGMVSACTDDVDPPPPPPDDADHPTSAVEEGPEESDAAKDNKDTQDVTKEEDASDGGTTGVVQYDGYPSEGCKNSSGDDDKDELAVMVLPYPKYCRYRAMMKRLEGVASKWLRNTFVIALGGFALPGRKTHILFCRDTFDHEELAQHDMNCEYLAPAVKKKRRRRKGKNMRSTSPDSESITSDESKDTSYKGSIKEVKNGLKKQIPCKTEQEFLQKLFKFMKERNTPIQRVPHLGFKQIDLFLFFTFAQKLGGYDKITGKKLWKHVYDELGGDPGSTSAATCTRKHYERLLLPFERFMEGKECEVTADPTRPRGKKMNKDGNEPCDTKEASNNGAGEVEDAYTFTDSNHENSNSKDSSNMVGDAISGGEENLSKSEGLSDSDNKTVWSVQQKPDAKDEVDKDNCKQVKPLIIQKGQNETFSEKERKWNEIRRKNALARKRVRQLRPSRGFKMPSAKMLPESLSLNQRQELPSIKVELDSKEEKTVESDVKPPVEASPEVASLNKTIVSVNTNRRKGRCSLDNSRILAVPIKPDVSKYLQDKINSATRLLDSDVIADVNGLPFAPSSQAPILVDKNIKLQSPYIKPEPSNVDVKSWYGYSKNSLPYQKLQPASMSPVSANFFNMSNSIKEEPKPMSHSMSDSTCDTVKSPEQNTVHCGVFPPSVKMEISSNDEASNVSQRRPSVIQHTEFITSPSASQSPKLLGVETSPETALKDGPHLLPSFVNDQKIDVISNHLSQTMAGKVAEWLTKGVPEVRACKTPPAVVTKATEFHNKVMTPSRTPGVDASKVHMYLSNKNRNQTYMASANRIIHDKYSSSYMYRKGLSSVHRLAPPCQPMNNIRNSTLSQQAFPPVQSTGFTGTFSDRSSKYSPTIGAPIRNPASVNGPYFNHPKRHKASPLSLPSSSVSARPSLLPSSHQQMYRTSPLSDVPRTTTSSCSGYENSVLDLSVKKRSGNMHSTTVATASVNAGVKVHSGDDGVCLDLSIKRKPSSSFTSNNGIENITPPLPASPSPAVSQASSSFSITPTLKPLPTLLSLHDLVMEEAALQNSCSSSRKTNSHMALAHHASSPIPPHFVPTSSVTLPANSRGAVHPGLVSPLPHTLYSKDVGKHMYLPKEHHSQFLPYVIPSFYSQNWTPSVSSSVNSSSYSKTSPNISKGTAAHNVFPKHHPYNYNPQLYPALCKDNMQHPSNTK